MIDKEILNDTSNNTDPKLKNVLTLAYLGDSIFTFLVRKYLVEHCNAKPNQLNKRANSVVCAKTQSEIMQILYEELTEDEIDIVHRARNAHLNNKAKNSTLAEYSQATQFEALLGYWYLSGEVDKIYDMFARLVEERLC